MNQEATTQATAQARLLKIIERPHVSEKTTRLSDKVRQYGFKVIKDAQKQEIKQAVEMLFNVTVESVRVSNVKPKRKVFKQRPGVRKGWKKAYVKLKAGDEINFVGSE